MLSANSRTFFVKRQTKSKDLKQAIREKEIQLAKLEAHVDKSSICSDLYNKVVLEKAILNKDLQDLEKNNLVEAIKRVMPRRKVLICDYFRGRV